MTVEEIGFEPPSRPQRGYGGFVVALVVAAAVVWLVVSGGEDDSAAPGPSPSGSQTSPAPSASLTERGRPGIAGARFQLGLVCQPRTTRRTLDVRFTLVNPSPADLLLMNVAPDLPLRGLKPTQTTVTFGGCDDGSGEVLEEPRVPAGGSVLVVFSFGLPKSCPQALPVLADVTSRVFDVSGSGQRDVIPVYADLARVDFATCP